MRWLVLVVPAWAFAACGDAYQDGASTPDAGAADASSREDGAVGPGPSDGGPGEGGDTSAHHGGTLDTTFGAAGKAKLPSAAAYSLLPSGGIFLVNIGSGTAPSVEKRNPDGSADTTFPGVPPGGTPKMTPYWSAVAPDGSVVVQGLDDKYNVFIVHFKSDGSYDTAFGGGAGYAAVMAPPQTSQEPLRVAISPAGRILYSVQRYNPDSMELTTILGQLLADGTPDPAFSAPPAPTSGRFDWQGFAWTPSGKTLGVGDASSDGSVFVTTFDETGHVVLPPVTSQWGLSLAAAQAVVPFGASGALLLGFASVQDFKTSSLAVARYGDDGKLDATFGMGGFTVKRIGTAGTSGDRLTSGAIDAQGRVVAAGRSDGQLVVVRLTTTGAFDATFGTDGVLKLDLTNTYIPQVKILPSGAIVVASGDNTNDQSVYLYRILP